MYNSKQYDNLIKSSIDFFFPPLCLGCGEYTDADGSICQNCEQAVECFKQPFCMNCLSFTGSSNVCEGCKDNTIALYSYASYASPIKEIIIQYKFKGITHPAKYFAELIISQFKYALGQCSAKVLVPIPLYPSRENIRGYNQATLFANCLSDKLQCPVDESILIRCKKKKPQAKLSVAKRAENIKSVFEVTQIAGNIKKCILVDDVVTTGSTVLEARKQLLLAGYNVQAVISIAHAL